jgi:hypothetical protein
MCIDNKLQLLIIKVRLGTLHWCGVREGYALPLAALNYLPLAMSKGFSA